MAWHARLSLKLRLEAGRCVARFEHEGPLRILQTLYPEGDAITHNVLVHPPSGLVGGDTLELDVHAGAGAHGLVTTPGASRFYRSQGEPAVQRTRIALEEGARFEWLPLEAICYSGCMAQNHVTLDLAPGAELIGWDVAALGLPEAQLPFEQGSLLQHLELRDAWLERGTIIAIILALGINYVIMYFSKPIGKVLFKLNVMTSLVRIIGLIIAAIGLQMTLDGISEFIKINMTEIMHQTAASL